MKKTGHQFLIISFILILISSCDNNRVFEAYKEIPQSNWSKDSLVTFDIPVTDTIQNHNLYINVRNDISYNFSNLWLFVKINEPGGTAVTDTLEVLLADQSGRWLGDGFGGIKNQQIAYKGNVFFPISGDYKIVIQHGMREEPLKGITDIGFRVEKAD